MRKNGKLNTTYMVEMALLIAIILIMAFTPIGYIKTFGLEITLIVVPVAVGAVVLGPTRPLCNTAFDMGDMTPQSRLAPSMARWPVYILFDCIDDLFKFFNWDSSDALNFLKFSGCTEKSYFCTYPCAKVLFFRFGCLTPDRLLK